MCLGEAATEAVSALHPLCRAVAHHPSTYVIPGEITAMSDVEDYPGPSHQPVKEGQNPRGRADESMVKPPADPHPKKGKTRKRKQKPQ
jgi:hypothetical protein